MNKTKISIIIPYKNSAPWIKRCLTSLTNNLGNFEFIFINDSSTDNGKKIVEAATDNRIISLDNKHMPGVGGARNTGLDYMTGDWFSFLDSDDEILSNIYNIYTNEIKLTTANIIQFNVLMGLHNRRRPVRNRAYYNCDGLHNTDNMPYLWELGTNKIYNKEIFSSVRLNEEMKWGEDELFNLECLAIDNQIKCSKQYNFIWWHNNKESLFETASKEDLIKQVEELEKFALRQTDLEMKKFTYNWIDFHFTTHKYKKVGLTREEYYG